MSYYPVIGLEIHIQLNTKTKLFCSCLNEYTPDEPNKNICPFCTGQPGALPALNKEAVKKALQFGVSLGATIPEKTRWDRKNYFYPDLPAGYQISQYDNPIVEGGKLTFYIEDKKTGQFSKSEVSLTRAHLEADAGKSLHTKNKTLLDYNRSGCPLIETVTEPDITSKEQAAAFIAELQLLVRTIGISDADMEKGQMRFDCNISLRNETQQQSNSLPGYKVEIKNLNSIRSVSRAIEYETERQTQILNEGKIPVQETRGWRDDLNKSVSQRTKEMAHDYRYFPEPDLRVLEIRRSDIPNLENLPELPSVKREKYLSLGLTHQAANTFVTQPETESLLAAVLEKLKNPEKVFIKAVSNIILVNIISLAQKTQKPIDKIISSDKLLILTKYFTKNKINNQGLQKAIEILSEEQGQSVDEVLNEYNLLQITDHSVLEGVVNFVIDSNQAVVAEYKEGKHQVIGFLIGSCMKNSKGQGNPQIFKEILIKKLS